MELPNCFFLTGNIICKLKENRFSLSTDGSSDRGATEQLYPIVVRYYDEEVKNVISALVEIATTKENSTGKNIFNLIDDVLKRSGIPWKNLMCFGADNAAVMMGIHSGVAAFVRKANPEVFVLGCPCHLLHLAAEKGAGELPVSPGEILIAIYYYLEKSSKRNKAFKQVQQLCCVPNHAILKHVCTRWLSLEKSLDRLLEQWIPLQEYFCNEAVQKKGPTAGSGPAKKQKPATPAVPTKTQSLPHGSSKGSGKTVLQTGTTAPKKQKLAHPAVPAKIQSLPHGSSKGSGKTVLQTGTTAPKKQKLAHPAVPMKIQSLPHDSSKGSGKTVLQTGTTAPKK